jgi:hypothetical protein
LKTDVWTMWIHKLQLTWIQVDDTSVAVAVPAAVVVVVLVVLSEAVVVGTADVVERVAAADIVVADIAMGSKTRNYRL